MSIIDQGDIGQCDDCSDSSEPRRRMLVETSLHGAQIRLYVYVCPPCETSRRVS